MATPYENTVTQFENICAKLAEVSADLRPNYTVDGVAVNRFDFIRELQAMKAQMLKDHPGLDADLQPVFEVHADPGAC